MDGEGGEPVINIVGERVALGPLRRDLVEEYQRWYNDLSTSRTLGLSWPTTYDQQLALFEERVDDPHEVYFTVYERETLRPVGITNLYEIDDRHSRASFGITIGLPECRGKGYGTEATRLTLDYAFNAYGLENVMLTVYEFNAGGIRAYEKAGFREFGRRHRSSRMGGRLWDIVYMECLASSFDSPILAEAFLPPEEV
jgi:RimJ/RimL family protein N-acetyltransferase